MPVGPGALASFISTDGGVATVSLVVFDGKAARTKYADIAKKEAIKIAAKARLDQ